ncbi:APC family permease [Marinoscillum sp.]|uniref:APC family permease n=1 Tax=Marinoscillum sp. TaxID=2024838 RepID=UPI003BADA7B7
MLKREIRRWDLVLLLINSIIGAGIFGLPSKIYALSGIYSLAALLLCAVIVLIIVFNFAEVASRFDKTGGPYLYTLAAFGQIPAFIIGWILLITRISTYAALINLLATYMVFFYPPFQSQPWRAVIITLVTLLLTLINFIGVKNSTRFSNGLAIAKVLPLLIFVGVGFFFIDTSLVQAPESYPSSAEFATSVLVLIFAFTGFESVLVNTGEIQNPAKNIPFALILSILIVAVFYGLIQMVSMATLPGLATSNTPISDAAQLFMGSAGGLLITVGAVISISGTLNSVMLVGSRVPYALSEEHQFPGIFGRLNRKYQTPTQSLLLFSGVALLASLSGSFIYALSISVISKILIFLTVCMALIKLRRSEHQPTGYFKLRWGYLFAFGGIFASLWLLFSSKTTELTDVLLTIAIGLALFGVYKLLTHPGKKPK